MNAIGVGAVSGCGYVESRCSHTTAIQEGEMEFGAVLNLQPTHSNICAVLEHQRLQVFQFNHRKIQHAFSK